VLRQNGHIDVFPVGDGSDWARDPWSGVVLEGRLHGRGTVDMKAGTAASIIAYTYLHRYRENLRGSIGRFQFMFGHVGTNNISQRSQPSRTRKLAESSDLNTYFRTQGGGEIV
jgi:arginine utilization protein RocB